MKTVQIYNLHLINGEVRQAVEAFELKGKKTIVSLFQNMKDDDILCINDLIVGSDYIPRKNIVYISTGDVRIDAALDRFETNVSVLRRGKDGSKNQ